MDFLKEYYAINGEMNERIAKQEKVQKDAKEKAKKLYDEIQDIKQDKIWPLETEYNKAVEESGVRAWDLPEMKELSKKMKLLDKRIKYLGLYWAFKAGNIYMEVPKVLAAYGDKRVEYLGDILVDEFTVMRAFAAETGKDVNKWQLVIIGRSVFYEQKDYGIAASIKEEPKYYDIRVGMYSKPSVAALKELLEKEQSGRCGKESFKQVVYDKYMEEKKIFDEAVTEGGALADIPVSLLPFYCIKCGLTITKNQLGDYSDWENMVKCPSCETGAFRRGALGWRKDFKKEAA